MQIRELTKGMCVRIKSWEELTNEFTEDSDGDIVLPSNTLFNRDMRYLCNTIVTIRDYKIVRDHKIGCVFARVYFLEADMCGSPYECWTITSEMIKADVNKILNLTITM